MRTFLPLLVLVLALSACGEATTADTAVTEPPTATADTADAAQDPAANSGIPIEGEGDIGDGTGPQAPLTEPPLFGVSSETDSDAIPHYTSCWSTDGQGMCSDGIPQPQAVQLAGADQLVVTYAEGELTASWSAAFDTSDDSSATPPQSPLTVTAENAGIWLVDTSDVPEGPHAIWLSYNGEQGDSHTAFTLDVMR
ncbi:hypothetical protein BH23ACT9_BH23ACT9_18030 [soil metagenome]